MGTQECENRLYRDSSNYFPTDKYFMARMYSYGNRILYGGEE